MWREILVSVLALVPALLWVIFILPLVYRVRGLSLPLNPFRRSDVILSPNESVLLKGIAGFGVSLAIFYLGFAYSRWVLSGRPFDRPSWQTIEDAIGIAICSGIIFGLLDGIQSARERLNKQATK